MKRLVFIAAAGLAGAACALPARLSIATNPSLNSEDKRIFGAAVAACRKAGVAHKCFNDKDSSSVALESTLLNETDKKSIRAAIERLAGLAKENAVDFRNEFKRKYGLDDSDMETIDLGLSICDRLELNRNCLSLLKSDVLERNYANQLSTKEIVTFAMAQQLLVNIQKIDESRARKAEADRQIFLMGLQNSLDNWRYSTTNCSGFGGSVHCTTLHH